MAHFARAEATPVPVQAAVLRPVTWQATIQLAGAIDAAQTANLAAARAGTVVGVYFSSGQAVAAGTLLVKLADGPEQAQLALDSARQTQAQNTLARAEKLMTIAGASRAALEQAQADAAEASAQISYDQAVLAQLQVTAPFAGTLGIRNISAGDYVQAGQVVASLTQPGRLRVLFAVPQTESAGIRPGEDFTFTAPALPGAAAGRIAALSPQIDSATNARAAEGQITGASAALVPGMFGTVTLAAGAAEPAFAVPSTALNDSALGPFVYVLDPAGQNFTLRSVYITKLGDAGALSYVAAAGLRAGERILALGGFQQTDGASVSLQSP
jgi:RND family efflux transporter MFP subunit